MDTRAAMSASSTKMDGAAVLVEKSATASKPSGAAGSSPSARCTPSPCTGSPTSHDFQKSVLPPSESSTRGAAAVAHTAATDAAMPPSLAPSATPPSTFKSPAASPVFSPQMPDSNTNTSRAALGVSIAVEACGAAAQTLSAPAATPSSPALPPSAPSPPASAWLLPRDDVTYILSSLTWNVDLLRLLLPHAPCPLHLPGAEPLAEVPSPTAGELATSTALAAAPASPTLLSSDMNEEEANAEAGQEGSTVKCAAKSIVDGAATVCGASSAGTLQSLKADKRGDTSSVASKMHTSGASAQEAHHTRDSPAAVTDIVPNPRSLSPPPASSSSALTTSVAVSGTSGAVSTVPLTWSQYLFRGAGGGVRTVVGSQRNGATSVLGDDAARARQQPQQQSSLVRGQAPPPAFVHGVGRGLPHSHSDGALVREPKTSAGTPAAAPNSAYVSSSIFHAQYLPSLEEFQRQLEEHKHQQQLLLRQQQQQPPTLSATRLQQHLQQQQQQQQSQPHHYHRRRAATNKTFFYSPTPSVLSFATTAATTTVSASATDEGCVGEQQRCQLSCSGATVTSPRSPPLPLAEHRSHAAAASGTWSSSLPPSPPVSSSASQARRVLQQPQRLLGCSGLRLRPCTSSTLSLDNLDSGGGGGGGSDNEEAGGGIGATAETPSVRYPTPHSSRPSPSQPQQQSIMMLRAADQLRVSIVSSSAQRRSPLLLHTGDGRTSRDSRGSSRTTARDDDDENEEWALSRRGARGSRGVRPSSSLPASPTVSISSMSFSPVWSTTLSGRATPRTTLATGVGSSVANHNPHFNGSSFGGVGHASPYSAAKGRKNARRRRKPTCTRRRRIMRVYVPSITEGPKAASLYTAPTAEAQELLLQLQHRAAMSLLSGPTAKPLAGHSATATAVSPASSTPRTYAMAAGVRVSALPAPTASATSPAIQPCGVAASPRPSTFAEAARAKSGNGSGTSAGVLTPGQVQRQQRGFTDSSVPSSTAPRNPGEAEQTPHLLTLPQSLRSHETATDLLSASWSGVAAAPPSAAAAAPTPRSFTSAGSSSDGGPGDLGDEVGEPGRAEASMSTAADTSAEAHNRPLSAPASAAGSVTPVELPQWVRERPLSALYYQPWGLELLARYEASRHEQQLMRARTLRRLGLGVGSSTAVAGAAVSEVGVSGNKSSPAASMHSSSGTSPYTTSSPAEATAVPHVPVRSRPSLGTSRGGCTSTATAAAAAAEAPPTSSSSTSRVSWAAALRQPQRANLTSGSSGGVGSNAASAAANMITATTTMNNSSTATTATAAVDLRQRQRPLQLPAVVPEWPPELSAAEEMDAWEEAYYFGGVTTASSSSQQQEQQQHRQTRRSATKPRDRGASDTKKGHPEGKHGTLPTDLGGRVGGSSGQVKGLSSNTLVTCSAAASAAVLKRQQWWLNEEIQPPTLYLSRQRRSSRRRSRVAYPSDTFRSSTARRAGATSAAAELFGRHKDAHSTPTVDATAAAPTCVKALGEAVPVSHTAADPPASSSLTFASSVSRSDVTLYSDGHPRKKAAQLFYPAPSLHGVGAPLPSPFTKLDHRTIGQGAGTSGHAGVLLPVSAAVGTDAMQRGGDIADAQQKQQHVGVGNRAAEDEQVEMGASATQLEGSAVEQVVDSSGCDGGEEADAAKSGLQWHPPAWSSADNPHRSSSDRMSGATDSTSTTLAATCASTPAATPPVDVTAPRPCADVDVIFFLQKFMRAVLIVFIAQVRLQQLQQHQERELQAYPLHDATCPAGAYLLDQHAQVQRMRAKDRDGSRAIRGDPAAAGATAAAASDGGGLSKLERSALAFVRYYLADYRHMITAYVMRDDREVARRSAQAILSPPQASASTRSMLPPSAVAAPGAMGRGTSSAPDPLFQQDVLARWLHATRVKTVYEEAVRVATQGFPGDADANPPATPVDDVESLRTAQVYISGKDAAWQPLLMELLQVSRVVQCYSDGPVVAATGSAPSASATSPQRLLLASLEKFLAQPTLPLFRHAGSGASATPQALTTTPTSSAAPSTITATAASDSLASDLRMTTAPSLTPAQAAAAALMVEESDDFRAYLLSGYVREDAAAAADGSSATASATFAAKPATTALRHSQSAPTLSARVVQQRQHSSASSAAVMPPSTAVHAMSSHPQLQQPQSPSLLFDAGSLLQPLTWYPYAYMPGTANPYAQSADSNSTRITPAKAATASSMTLYVTMLPLSGRLLWRWVVPAEDTDNFNLSVFFQSSLFSFMQGGSLPMPSATPEWHAAAIGHGAVGYAPTPMAMLMAPSPSPHPSLTWPPALAARIDAQLRNDAFRAAWGEVSSPCMCGTAAAAVRKGHRFGSELCGEMPEVTLVHCSAGMHRSCGILVAFLLWLLYQCRQVLRTEQTLGLGPLSCMSAPAPSLPAGDEAAHDAAVKALLLDDVDALAPAAASAADGGDEEQQKQPAQRTKNTAADADAPWLTSRLLHRTIHHVQQQRSIAVPIRTVQCLLQSFANELRLN
ncbi:conserved hypothetical protein [Leishmania major strain Friedlin]|uniref:Uncharacterized protein n=1 Tax=Leishmania major TaxID=5664 RepID=E9ACJ6_LEIMA|nr:conserved hypothetical protein [Leishmania major strain Friedlin]CAG9567277.1 hypothetical_protein_-_conserved [Leishmania major strain Friedlin]CBZ12013.1 conserved hypothetical protein [Leishmania major strain Friedlin]|eukprot:XP_003721727.1 conserved hypothetical protein [Leishmania major strain Friedlin]